MDFFEKINGKNRIIKLYKIIRDELIYEEYSVRFVKMFDDEMNSIFCIKGTYVLLLRCKQL